MVLDVAAVGVDVGGEHRDRRGQGLLQPADEVAEQVGVAAAVFGEQVAPGLGVEQRVVDVHGAAGLVGDRLGHEGREAVVAQRGLADQPLEVEHLVGEAHRIAVAQVDLELPGAALLDDAVDLESLGLGEVVDVVDDRSELVHRGHRVGLPRRRRAARAAGHRLDLAGGVEIAGDQEELHLRRHHRLEAAPAVELDHPLEDVARRAGNRRAVAPGGVVDDLERPVPGPRRRGGGGHVRRHGHVALEKAAAVGGVAPVAGDGLEEDRFGQVEELLPAELRRRHRLAAGDARKVRDDALDLVEAVLPEIGARRLGQGVGPVRHGAPRP